MEKKKLRFAAQDIAECALFVALMVASVYIKIPFPVMPLTFQTVFAVMAGLMLGWKKGMVSMLVYALLGLAGLPFFTGGGGVFYVLKPSFGYIIGFIASAAVAGICYNCPKKLWLIISLALAATAVDYVIGIAYFAAVWLIMKNPALWQSILSYNLIYLPKDILLAIPAALISRIVTPVIIKMRGKARKTN